MFGIASFAQSPYASLSNAVFSATDWTTIADMPKSIWKLKI